MKTSGIQRNARSNAPISRPFFNKSGKGGFFPRSHGSGNSFFQPANDKNTNDIQLQESEESSPTSSGLSSVKIWFKAFIPGHIPNLTRTVRHGTHAGQTMIPGPTPISDCFLTDNRSWDNSLSAKSRMNSVIDLDLSGTPSVNSEFHWCDATTELDCEDGEEECSERGSNSRMRFFNLRSNTSGQVLINLEGAANNPCFSGSPDIDYNGVAMIDPTRRIIQFQGNVDGFPDYEMYVNGNTILRIPHPTGNTPGDLVGGANRAVSGRTSF